jgi:hypothetical protein
MKTYGGVDVQIHLFLTSTLFGAEWPASRPGRFTPGTHWTGGCVGPSTCLADLERRKFLPPPGLKLRSLGRTARSQSLYKLRYSGSTCLRYACKIH